MRGDGKTADQIAEALNQEGYAVPRGERYTGHRVRQLFARLGLTGIPPGVRDEGDLPAAGEWWLPALASELGVKPIVYPGAAHGFWWMDAEMEHARELTEQLGAFLR